MPRSSCGEYYSSELASADDMVETMCQLTHGPEQHEEGSTISGNEHVAGSPAAFAASPIPSLRLARKDSGADEQEAVASPAPFDQPPTRPPGSGKERLRRCFDSLPRPFLHSLAWAVRLSLVVLACCIIASAPSVVRPNRVLQSPWLIPIFAALGTQLTLGESLQTCVFIMIGAVEGGVVGALGVLPFLPGGTVVAMVGFVICVLAFYFLERQPMRRVVGVALIVIIQLTFIVRRQNSLPLDLRIAVKVTVSCLFAGVMGILGSLPFPLRKSSIVTRQLSAACNAAALALDSLVAGFLTRTQEYEAQYHLARGAQLIQLVASQLAAVRAALPLAAWDAVQFPVARHARVLRRLDRLLVMLRLAHQATASAPTNALYIESFQPLIAPVLRQCASSVRACLSAVGAELNGTSLGVLMQYRATGIADAAAQVNALLAIMRQSRSTLFLETDSDTSGFRSVADGVNMYAMTHAIEHAMTITLQLCIDTNLTGTTEAELAAMGARLASANSGQSGAAASPSVSRTAPLAANLASVHLWADERTDAPAPAVQSVSQRLLRHVDFVRSREARAAGADALYFSVEVLLAALIVVIRPLSRRLDFAIWAPITVCFLHQKSIGGSFRRAILRLEGTVAGAVFGYAVMLAVASSRTWQLVLVTLWTAFIGYFRTNTYYGYASLVAVVTSVLIIYGNPNPNVLPARFALSRIVQTFIGSAIVLFVSLFRRSPWTAPQLRGAALSTLQQARELVLTLLEPARLAKDAAAALASGADTTAGSTLVAAVAGLRASLVGGRSPYDCIAALEALLAQQDGLVASTAIEPQLWREPVPVPQQLVFIAAQAKLTRSLTWLASAVTTLDQLGGFDSLADFVSPLRTTLTLIEAVLVKTLDEIAQRLAWAAAAAAGPDDRRADLHLEAHAASSLGRPQQANAFRPGHSLSLHAIKPRLLSIWGAVLAQQISQNRWQPDTAEAMLPFAKVLVLSTVVFSCICVAEDTSALWSAVIELEQARRIQAFL